MRQQHYDVIIIGGAMSGATLALMLAQANLRVAVVEQHLPKTHHDGGFDARCIALSHGSMQLLNTVRGKQGSLLSALRDALTTIEQIHISDRGHSGIVNIDATKLNLHALGAVVALAHMGKVLMAFIAQQPHIDYLAPASVAQIDYLSDHVRVSLTTGETLHATLLVAADGTQSHTARAAGIGLETLTDYGQSAVIANVKTERPHQHTAFERFTAHGPVALLPMTDNVMSLVWCEHTPRAQQLLTADEPHFLSELQRAFGWRLGKFEQVSHRFCYPLKLQKAYMLHAHRLVLVGNAAQTLHPIAGQGFNLGLRDIATLAQMLTQAHAQEHDIGTSALLSEYARAREADKTRIMGLTDSLVSIFANPLLPFALGRNLGLGWLACHRTLRQHVIKPTLGWAL
ncbi:2-octaprenyl-6-methoxyphenyl hydroxylase [Pasteurellaceae bacterium HPA106]|uniref:2-octaprenyl-6-methoxyphenyl hydroxylase n=1 Tax=Spirabiliibacterium pneumoniae TaxID=221400 RepID=UPI001AAD8757|nr:2-octaprenyl-6-methoxyphenyl hydroxylase [Spirabiliibacterium pneumoniae]MBE2895797.1 2-octaprenyl-6-methoxyphenyl hydroxylase [Spirabiliibacterium pneumoniae]